MLFPVIGGGVDAINDCVVIIVAVWAWHDELIFKVCPSVNTKSILSRVNKSLALDAALSTNKISSLKIPIVAESVFEQSTRVCSKES